MENTKTKQCFKCNTIQPLTAFYKHKKMADGHLNKCKSCTKKDSIKQHHFKSNDIEWVEKQRERGREKYKRLGYYKRQKEARKNKPWSNSSVYKGQSKANKVPKGFELHHWNYNDEFISDVFIMQINQHRRAHTHLTLDLHTKTFKDDQGNYLDTREKHFQYLAQKGIIF